MGKVSLQRALRVIDKTGVLLLFPIKNNAGIPSLWEQLFPGQAMNWDWSEEGDNRVAELWHLRTEIATSRAAVYTKWFRNRGTLFSLELFTALLNHVSSIDPSQQKLGVDARTLLMALEDNSPRATKALKRECDLEGADTRSRFERGMRELWAKLLIVGYGELEEGGYPSLAVGSTRLLFEEPWDASKELAPRTRDDTVERFMDRGSSLYQHYAKFCRSHLVATTARQGSPRSAPRE